MSMSTRGRMTSTAMSDASPRKLARGRDNITDLRRGRLFEHGTVGDGRLGAAQADDRRVEKVERLALRDRGADLGADAQRLDALRRRTSAVTSSSRLRQIAPISSGRSERKLITSASTPSLASAPAASSALNAMIPDAAIVMSEPLRAISALSSETV